MLSLMAMAGGVSEHILLRNKKKILCEAVIAARYMFWCKIYPSLLILVLLNPMCTAFPNSGDPDPNSGDPDQLASSEAN